MDTITTDVRHRHWANIIKAANNSNMTRAEFCSKNGIKLKTFYYYQHKLRTKAYELFADDQPVPLVEIPIQQPEGSSLNPVAVICIRDVTVEVTNGISESTLMSIGRMIRNAL